jgi:hypothetical protein
MMEEMMKSLDNEIKNRIEELAKIPEEYSKQFISEGIISDSQQFPPDNITFENPEEQTFIFMLGQKGLLKHGTRRVVKSLPTLAYYLKFELDMKIDYQYLMDHFRKKDGSKFTEKTCHSALTTAYQNFSNK